MNIKDIDLNNLNDPKTMEFIDLNKTDFAKPELVAPFTYQLYEKGCPRIIAHAILTACSYSFDTDYINVADIVEKILNDVYNGRAFTSPNTKVGITNKEASTLNAIGDPDLRILMLSLLVYSKQYNHESGWINFGRKKIFAQAGMAKMPERKKNALLQLANEKKLLSMRVIGKKNPTLCYNLPWRSCTGIILEDDEIITEVEVGPIAKPKEIATKADIIGSCHVSNLSDKEDK